jgi:hypothetical protein
MFLLRPEFSLTVQGFQSMRKVSAGLSRLNNFVNQTPARCDIRVGKRLAILFD